MADSLALEALLLEPQDEADVSGVDRRRRGLRLVVADCQLALNQTELSHRSIRSRSITRGSVKAL